MKTLDIKLILRQYVPSAFFVILLVCGMIGSPLPVKLICSGIALLIAANLYFRNNVISGITGTVFLLISCYMILAMLDDFVDGEATKSYIFGLALILFCLPMSVLMIWGFRKGL